MECILEHPITNVAMITLAARDAYGFYDKFGFIQSEDMAQRFMIKRKDNGILDACLKITR